MQFGTPWSRVRNATGEVLNLSVGVLNPMREVLNPALEVPNLTVAVRHPIGCKSDANANPHRYNCPRCRTNGSLV